MNVHINEINKKTERTIMALSRLMPNIRGQTTSKLKILGSVAHSVMLYAAPTWEKAMRNKKYKNMLIKLLRRLAIRVGSAYRTISMEPIQVITGIKPII
ncbi:hypothetical protein NQ314_013200 [Rhamnusium bicolor]|uniref:Uncharacterized protein n=1 Tax=Rhamnusium bicolor TaxID=1586634 RepID=A0AAV8X888_9CUCU|nr:hypothetical protein NQ314_013200 [Rhamnusium bicolor]